MVNFTRYLVLCAIVLGMAVSGCDDDSTDDPNPVSVDQYGWTAGEIEGNYGAIYHTSDGGATWQRQGDSLTVPNTPLVEVRAYSEDIVWVSGSSADGYGTLLKSTDGGTTWERKGSADQFPNGDIRGVGIVDENTIWISGQDNTILLSQDGGDTWIDKSDPTYDGIDLADLVAVSATNVWICGGNTDGLILHTIDGGDTWRSEADSLLPTHTMITMSAVNENYAWGVGHGGLVLRTTDGGDTWTSHSPIEGSSFIDVNGVCAVNESLVWVVMDYGNIYVTQDNGETWTQQTSNADGYYLFRVTAQDEQNAWITGLTHVPPITGIMLNTTDGGATWTEVDYGSNVGLWDIHFVGAYH